jgi:hypothetical protein
MKTTTKLWIGIVILILLTPLGLFLPEHFKAGTAWGEWGADSIKELMGYIPRGFEKISSLWNAPLADYSVKGLENKGMEGASLAYILSAIVGIAVTVFLMFLIGKALTRTKDRS